MLYPAPLLYALIIFMVGLNSSCSSDKRVTLIHKNVKAPDNFSWQEDSTVLVISGNSTTSTRDALSLDRGKYVITFKARGTIAGDGGLPHLKIGLGDDLMLTNLGIKAGENMYRIKFELQQPAAAPLHFIFDNDYADDIGDRNIYLLFPVVIKAY